MGHEMPSRRLLLKVGLIAGGGLMLGLRLPSLARAAGAAPDVAGQFVPNAFARIDPQGAITLIMPHTEFGQGVYTSSAMLMGEELEVGLDQIQVQPAPPDLAKYMDPILFDQATGGSTSTRADWMRLREAAAAARTMLVAAAAKRWVSIRQAVASSGAWCITRPAIVRSAMAMSPVTPPSRPCHSMSSSRTSRSSN